ncbi:MAG: BadF/BadG/BcrA/BcrD ATPase family protein [Acidobacteriaceae bacterium]
MAYYLGIDAGATKTECALAEESTILARATGGTIKVMRASEQEAGKNLDTLLESVSSKSEVPLDAIACTGVGLAGVSVPRIADWVRSALKARVSGPIVLSGDEVIALDAAFFGGRGVLVMAGTGSNMVGRAADGRLIHVGGWGPVVADEGSGGWIGKQTVRAIFDALDRGDKTLLLDHVLERWKIHTVGALIDLANQLPGPDFSKLAPLTARCAEQGDSYAHRVLEQAGNALAQYATLTARRVQAMEREFPEKGSYPDIAFTGSILRYIAPVREAMRAAILRETPGAQIQPDAVDSVQGALWRARQHCTNPS